MGLVYKFDKYLPRTYQELLDLYREEAIYMFYLGNHFKINEFINSPFPDRRDSSPSFRLSYHNNMLLWHDFGDHNTEGYPKSVIGFVMRYFGIDDYKDAIEKITEDLDGFVIGTGIMKEVDSIRAKGNKISKPGIVVRKDFTDFDLEFWHTLDVTAALLREYDVYSALEVYIGGRLWRKSSRLDPMFAYVLNNSVADYAFQAYRPSAETKLNKFRNHNTDGKIFGLKQLPQKGDVLIITKSCKDVLALKAMDYWAICPFGEASYVHLVAIMPGLIGRFNKVLLMYDPDETGIAYSVKITSQFEGALINVLIPDQFKKDPSDNILAGLKQEFSEFLKNKIIE